MKRYILLLQLILIAVLQTTAATRSEAEDVAIIRSRYTQFYASQSPDEATIKGYLDKLDTDTGAWNDIDYASTIGSNWRTKMHTTRTMEMAKYYVNEKFEPTSFTREQLLAAIHSAWGYWFRERPYCTTNWFPNNLSCPHELGISFMLLQDKMSPQEQKNAVNIVFKMSKISKTGSNLIYMANTALLQGIFQNDIELIHRAIDAISGTIFIAKNGEEGIQSDYSYHLHGAQQQFGNYGREAIAILSPFCQILNDTSFDFSPEQKDIVSKLITEGYRWVLWRGYMDMIASGRQYGPDMFKDKCENILASSKLIAEGSSPEQHDLIYDMVKENDGKRRITLLGQKYFDKSDCFVHRGKVWAASLKMHSTRVKGTEVFVGSDNKRGYYSPDGALYTYVDGGEYENAAPLWDWRKVPGVTCYDLGEAGRDTYDRSVIGSIRNRSNFAGACTDGTQGIASMILDKSNLHLKKSWIITPEFILCLGSDLKDKSGKAALATSVEQRLANGDLTILANGKWRGINGTETTHEAGVRLHHDKVGYIILDESECVASVVEREGNWTDVTVAYDPIDVKDQMLSIYIRHTRQPSNYQYLVLPNKSQSEVAKFKTDKIEILSNSKDLHLVRYDGKYYTTIYNSGSYNIGNISIEARNAGIYMFSRHKGEWQIIAHDPTQKLSNDAIAASITIHD